MTGNWHILVRVGTGDKLKKEERASKKGRVRWTYSCQEKKSSNKGEKPVARLERGKGALKGGRPQDTQAKAQQKRDCRREKVQKTNGIWERPQTKRGVGERVSQVLARKKILITLRKQKEGPEGEGANILNPYIREDVLLDHARK